MNAEYHISIIWGYETEYSAEEVYSFNTQAELWAFRLGIAEAVEWGSYKVVGEYE